jgi:hypothetical protein
MVQKNKPTTRKPTELCSSKQGFVIHETQIPFEPKIFGVLITAAFFILFNL